MWNVCKKTTWYNQKKEGAWGCGGGQESDNKLSGMPFQGKGNLYFYQ